MVMFCVDIKIITFITYTGTAYRRTFLYIKSYFYNAQCFSVQPFSTKAVI